MPLKHPYLSSQPQAAQEAPSLWERIGGLPGVLGTGIRATTGVLSAEGGPLGALTSGGGEGAAELVEGSAFKPSRLDPNSMLGGIQASLDPGENEPSWLSKLKGFAQGAMSPVARIGTAAGIGAVPFGKVLQAGKPLASAGRGALYSGVGEFGREIAEGKQVDPGAIGTSAAIGGALNAGLSKLLGPAAAEKAPGWEVEPTARTGMGTSTGAGKARKENVFPPRVSDIASIKSTEPLPVLATEATRQRVSSPVPYSYEYAGGPAAKSAATEAANATKEELRDQRNLANVEKWLTRTRAASAKATEQETAAAKIIADREAAGVVADPARFGESISAPNPAGPGRISKSTSYSPPEPPADTGKEGLDALGKALGVAPKGPKGGPKPAKGGGRQVGPAVKVAEDWQPPYGGSTAPTPADLGNSARAAREAAFQERYKGWLDHGLSDVEAQRQAALGRTADMAPAAPGQSPLAKVLTPAAPAVEKAVTPTAVYLGEQEGLGPLYNIQGGPSHGSTVGAEKLQELGIEVPPAGAPMAKPAPRSALPAVIENNVPPAAIAGDVTSDSIASAKAAAQAERAAAEVANPGKVINEEGKFKPADFIDVTQPKAIEGAVAPPALKPLDPGVAQDIATYGEDVVARAKQIQAEGNTATGKEFPWSLSLRRAAAEKEAAVPAVSPAVAHAKANFPDEVNAELDRLGEAYRSTPKGPEKKALGAQMSELRDFMSGKKMRESWKGAPVEPVAAPPAPAPIAQQLEESLTAREPQTRSIEPDVPAVRTEQNYAERQGKLDELQQLLKAQPQGPRGGSTVSALGGGQLANMLAIAKENPQFATKLGMGLGGAALGAATDPLDNPFESAVAGGVLGVGAAHLPQILSQLGTAPELLQNLSANIRTPQGINETAGKIWHAIPQMQRFNYLMNANGLAANALAGPYGSAFFAALEHSLAGDPRGVEALNLLKDPRNFYRELRSSFDEAKMLINRSESRWADTGPANTFERVMAIPGTAMTAGDVAAKRILMRAGFTAEEAQRITLTSEPESVLGQHAANFAKGTSLGSIMLPFARTPTNIAEQGLQRLPGIGFLVQAQRETPDPIKQQAIQQLMSLGVGGASYGLGSNLDPESAKTLRRYVTNFGGQYSLPANIGFAAGQSARAGQPALSRSTISAGVDALPLPTAKPITEWANFLLGNGPLPSGAIPSDIRNVISPPAASSPSGRLPKLKRSL